MYSQPYIQLCVCESPRLLPRVWRRRPRNAPAAASLTRAAASPPPNDSGLPPRQRRRREGRVGIHARFSPGLGKTSHSMLFIMAKDGRTLMWPLWRGGRKAEFTARRPLLRDLMRGKGIWSLMRRFLRRFYACILGGDVARARPWVRRKEIYIYIYKYFLIFPSTLLLLCFQAIFSKKKREREDEAVIY